MMADYAVIGRIVDRTVDSPDRCWTWTGATNGVGYGTISVYGKRTYTHRAMFIATGRVIPDGFVLDHLCRNTLCCNPCHLEAVTQGENVRRGLSGAPQGICKHGHKFDEANTYIDRFGRRACRACKARCEVERRLRFRLNAKGL